MDNLGTNTDQQPRPRRGWIIWSAIAAGLVVVAAAVGIAFAVTRGGDECENWADEMIPAIEDGTMADGSFEPSEACVEQFRRDLEQLSRP